MRDTVDFNVMDFQREPEVDTTMRQFYTEAVEDKDASLANGRFIAKEVDFCKIRFPGSSNVLVVEMNEFAMKGPHGRAYAKWKAIELANGEHAIEGTPLETVTWLTKSLVLELKHLNVHTVENLANVSDTNAQKMTGLTILRSKAKAFLLASKESAPIQKLQSQIDKLVADLQVKQQTIDQLVARLPIEERLNVPAHGSVDVPERLDFSQPKKRARKT